MNFQLNFPIPKSEIDIKHGDKIALIGSCFSDSVSTHFTKSGFQVLSNPFGTIFHPTAIASCLQDVLNDKDHVDVVQRNDLFFSWDSAESLVGSNEEELIETVIAKRQEFKGYLKSAKLLVITFGTSWGYHQTELDKIVGNNHKMPAALFTKRLMEVEPETNKWEYIVKRLKGLNPNLSVVFTVSPVRHAKDGLVNNSRSKARLIELVHSTLEEADAAYFPSYEIVIDELRDYRFFKECRIHPNEEAVKYVWNRFEETYFSKETQDLSQKVRNLHRTFDHRTLHPNSEETRRHLDLSEGKLSKLREEFPDVWWE
ncbi:MAG: GSCFA domain-containing protein [Crocinitomicaceae bacterium]|nr:GSCFA domain-containing protein [Crocinitomicaceae bacterium]